MIKIKKLKEFIPLSIKNVIKYLYNFLLNIFLFLHQIISKYTNENKIKFLTFNIPKVLTNEINGRNDCYGHASILKKYCALKNNYKLKCIIEHGVYFSDFIIEKDFKFELPGIIFMGKNREQALKEKNIKCFPIGPYIAYSNNFLSKNQIKKEKKRLGENLLFIPTHSTRNVKCDYDILKTCNILKNYKKDFDTIRICLYWKDILNNHHLKYQDMGFECVCAGHMFDKFFLPRLKSILSVSSMILTNKLGTHIGYSVHLEKPVVMYREKEFQYAYSNSEVMKDSLLRIEKNNDINELFINAFSSYNDKITEEQYSLVNQYWGLTEIKNPNELKEIFYECELLYNNINKT